MSNKNTFEAQPLIAMVILAIILIAGCAARKEIPGMTKQGLMLQYLMPENQVLKYQTINGFTQHLNIRGQSMKVESRETTEFTIKSKGQKEDNHQLEVIIDSMNISINTPRGEISPDMSPVWDKNFDMILSPLGRELDLSGADSIQYELRSGQKRGIGSGFQTIFPNLPGRFIKIGDTWTTKDTITEESGEGELRISLESVNKLEGLETINGLECAKITAVFTGTLDGKGEEQGAELITKADVEGTETWYFAYKKGVFVKAINNGTAKGTVTGSGPQQISIPLTREFQYDIKLIKW
jgi:hypothetical protein